MVEKHAKSSGGKPVANPVVIQRDEFDDWAVLYNPDTAEAAGINPVGVAVWNLIDGRRSVDDIVVSVQEQFSDVPEAAAGELAAFIASLAEKGFVGYDEGDAP